MSWNEEDGHVSVFRQPSNYTNGNTRDRQGRLLSCEHDARRVSRTEHDGSITAIIDSFDGKKLNAPNDVVVAADESIWFTDPGYGIFGNYEGHSLWYVRGGAAFGDMRVTTNCNTDGVVPNPAFLVVGACGENATRNRGGWTIGFGSEFALARNWTVRAETNYFDMGTARYTLPSSTIDVRETGFTSTVGLNYRFSPGVVVAKY